MSWYWFECPKYFSIIRIHIRISLSILFNQFLLTKRQLANVALSNFLKISKIMCGNLMQILYIIVSYGVCKRIILKSGKKCYLLWRVKKQQDNFCKQSKPIFTKPWWKLKLSPTQVLVLTPKYLCNRYFVIHKSIPSSKELSNYYRWSLVLLEGHLCFKGSKTSHFIRKCYFYKSLMTLEGRF